MAAATASNGDKSSKCLPFNHFHPTDFLFKWITLEVFDEDTLSELRLDRQRQTPQIEDYPCRVFLVDYEDDLRIRVWLLEQQARVDTCSDYMYEPNGKKQMEPCWVCKWLDVDEKWMVDTKEIIDETIIKKPDFYRLHGDRDVHFGDGGQAFLTYPVWIHEQLPISESRRQRLTNILYDLNEKRQDHHPSPSPVEDIIDPDLLPYKPSPVFNRDRWIERRLKQLKNSDRAVRTFKRDLNNGGYNDLSEHEQIRDSYQWVPSEFVIDKDGKVDIQTPIHHLPVLPEYKHAYGDIARIFHAMLPMFEELKLIKLKNIQEQQRLQVIVKAQSYNLKAGKTIITTNMSLHRKTICSFLSRYEIFRSMAY